MRRVVAAGLAIAIVSLIFCTGMVSATTSSTTTTSSADGFKHYSGQAITTVNPPFHLLFGGTGSEVHLDYFIGTSNNVTLDIMVMTIVAYADYLVNGTAQYIEGPTHLNTMADIYTGALPEGYYVLVVAAANSLGSASEFIYSVNTGPMNGMMMLMIIVIATILIIVVVAVLLILLLRSKSKVKPGPVPPLSYVPSTFCGKCGNELQAGIEVCPRCGHKNS